MKNRSILYFLGGIVILAAAFLFINFRAAKSSTEAEHRLIKTSSGEVLPEILPAQSKITVVLVGRDQLVNALQKSIYIEMEKVGIENVELGQELEAAYENPVLIIDINQTDVLWTPVFASSKLSVQAGYASNGDTTFMGDIPITYNSNQGPRINISGEYEVNDRSWGLMSRPGYYQMLADWLARTIVEGMKNQ